MRKFRFNLLYILVATLFAGALQSCDDNYFRGEDGSKVTITATTAFSNTTSRAVYEDDTYFENEDIEITNYCFLLFDSDKKLIDAFDVTPSDMPYSVELDRPLVGEKSYYAFLLGNVDEATLGAISVIDDLKSCTFAITRTYNNPKEDEKDKFTWSGYLPFTQSTQSLDFVLNPNVAKITANITNNSSESVIKSVRVKNVLSKVGYAQNALNEYDDTSITNISTVEEDFIKYDIETLETPIEAGQTKTISWYVPQNIQGEGKRKPTDDALANESGLDGGDGKDGYLPSNATYVEIDGVRPSDNVTASYRVYPGIKKGSESYADMTNFDIKADVIYNLDVTINNDGIETNIDNEYKPNDGSTATAKIKLPENSNCYMIHPIGDRIADVTVYELPISRINQYWTTVAGEDGTADSHHALTADSKWQVEVIWQDINKRAIRFCDEYGNTLNDVAPGEGLNPFCFKLENISAAPGSQTYGNVLVGIKKLKSDGTPLDGYCWSWHLWITDYNPDKATPYDGTASRIWQSDQTVDLQGEVVSNNANDGSFTSTGDESSLSYHRVHWGNVQHYNSLWDWYWKTNPKSASVWDNNGIYYNKWIMDRNLGAISCNIGNEQNPLDGWGMYYQYGRKDPFSYKIVYDITGQTKIHSYSTPGVNSPQWEIINAQASDLSEGVKNPNNYYAASASVSWVNKEITTPWFSPSNDPMSPNYSKCQKTLFDPCPPGWCMPSMDAFDFGIYAFDKDGKTVPTGYLYAGPNDKVVDLTKEFGYARYYASDMEYNFSKYSNPNDKYAHTAVTVHVDVNGTYNTDQTTLDKQGSTYNNSINSYRKRERMFATLYSTTDIGYFKTLKSVFPMQGRISGDGSAAGKLGMVALEEGSSIGYQEQGVRLLTYYCTMGNQACLWTLENGGDERQATLLLFQAVALNNRIEPRQEVSGGRLFLRFHGYMAINNYLTSRGQNVRCIQEPD